MKLNGQRFVTNSSFHLKFFLFSLNIIFIFTNLWHNSFAQEIDIDPPNMPLDVMAVLKKYPFPGNIRELKNIIERLVVLSSQGLISASELPARIWEEKCIPKDLRSYRQMIEKQHIQKILLENDYKVGVTSEVLGISRRQLTNKMNEYNLR